jgi:hypothetical protein
MLNVNNQTIKVYKTDTADTIRFRVAAVLKTLPSLLPDVDFESGNSYNVNPKFYLDNNDMPQMGMDVLDQNESPLIVKLYIITKIDEILKEFLGMGMNMQNALAVGISNIEQEVNFKYEEIHDQIWAKRKDITREFVDMVLNNQRIAKDQVESLNTWTGVAAKFKHSRFSITKVINETIVPNPDKITEEMIFDAINLTKHAVACFYKNMVKFNHSVKMDNYFNNAHLGKPKLRKRKIVKPSIQVMIVIPMKELPTFIDIFVGENSVNFTINIDTNERMSINVGGSYAHKKIIQKLINDINLDSSVTTEKEYYYGQYSAFAHVPTTIMKELVTNDKNVRSLCYMNEANIISTKTTHVNLYLRDSDVGIGVFENVESGMLIKVRRFMGSSGEIIDIVNKILAYSITQASQISKFYNEYIQIDLDIRQISSKVEKKNVLKTHVPDIFLPTYSRLCAHPPVIADPHAPLDDATLRFPIHGEAEPKTYTCLNKEYKYIGLRKNNLANSDVFPVLPCCYKQPQSSKAIYKTYFSGEKHVQRINTGEFGKTIKILAERRVAELPPRLNKLFSYTLGKKFYRYGIAKGPNSCLDALNIATKLKKDHLSIREELVKRAHLCKTEMGNFTIKSIANKLKDPNTYISPRYFKGALEDYYQISYILFSKDHDDFSVYPDRFLRFICPFKNKVLFLIEHEKSEHVELMLDQDMTNFINTTKKGVFHFDKNETEIKKIGKLYKSRFTFILSTQQIDQQRRMYPWEYHNGNNKILSKVTPLFQYIDEYGKTRLVEFEFEKIKFVSQFDPLPCVTLECKKLKHLENVNKKLDMATQTYLKQKFKWLNIYKTYESSDDEYKTFLYNKKLAEYLFWAACHFYSLAWQKDKLSVDEWIDQYTSVIQDYTYSHVHIGATFNDGQLLVDGVFVCNTAELQKRIRFNLSLISVLVLKMYTVNLYHNFYKSIDNFKQDRDKGVQIVTSKQEYYQRTAQPLSLNLLTQSNLQYIQLNQLYYLTDVFGPLSSYTCLMLPTIENVVEEFNKDGQDLKNYKVVIFDFEKAKLSPDGFSIGDENDNQAIVVVFKTTTIFYGLIKSF